MQREMTADEKAVYEHILAGLPPVIARHDVPRLLGGLVSHSTLTKEDSLGTGPLAFRLGGHTQAGAVSERGKVFYKAGDLLDWVFTKWGVKKLVNVNQTFSDGRRASS